MPGYPRAGGGGVYKLLTDKKKDRLNERKKNKSQTRPSMPAKMPKKK